MHFSILSWNVRCLGRFEKRLQVKDTINCSSVEFLVLVELKFKSIPRAFFVPNLFIHIGGCCVSSFYWVCLWNLDGLGCDRNRGCVIVV